MSIVLPALRTTGSPLAPGEDARFGVAVAVVAGDDVSGAELACGCGGGVSFFTLWPEIASGLLLQARTRRVMGSVIRKRAGRRMLFSGDVWCDGGRRGTCVLHAA